MVFSGRLLAYLSDLHGGWQTIPLRNPILDPIDDVWRDPDAPSVFVLIAGGKLFWTNDAGASYVEAALPDEAGLFSITRVGHGFRFPSARGIYYADDHIPRGPWWSGAWRLIADHPGWSATIAGLCLLLLFGSTRLILKFLVWDIHPVPEVADWFYSTALGRRRLYGPYRKTIGRKLRAIESIYVELPFTAGGDRREECSRYVAEALQARSVFVQAPGGRGKTTLCQVITHRASQTATLPLMIRGAEFNGSLVDWIHAELSVNQKWVTRRIVEAHLLAGLYLLIFDAFNEASLGQDAVVQLAGSLRQFGLQRFLMTSRTPLDRALREGVGELETIEICELDPSSVAERDLIAAYVRGDKDQRQAVAARIQPQLDARLPNMPRVPLMLRLISQVYDHTSSIPQSRAAILDLYVQQSLERTVTKSCSHEGLSYAIRVLTESTFLASGGQRRGFTHNFVINVLHARKADLESRNVKLSALDLIETLIRSGLYQRRRNLITTWHPLQEDFFAAKALDLRMDEQGGLLRPGVPEEEELATARELLRELRGSDSAALGGEA